MCHTCRNFSGLAPVPTVGRQFHQSKELFFLKKSQVDTSNYIDLALIGFCAAACNLWSCTTLKKKKEKWKERFPFSKKYEVCTINIQTYSELNAW